MIDVKDLQVAISETEQLPESYQKCQKLAVFYYLLDRMENEDNKKIAVKINNNQSEFLKLASRADPESLFELLDELVGTIKVINNNLYNAFLNKLKKEVT